MVVVLSKLQKDVVVSKFATKVVMLLVQVRGRSLLSTTKGKLLLSVCDRFLLYVMSGRLPYHYFVLLSVTTAGMIVGGTKQGRRMGDMVFGNPRSSYSKKKLSTFHYYGN